MTADTNKRKCTSIIIGSLLILLDQLIKILIKFHWMGTTFTMNNMLSFRPKFNTRVSSINTLFNLNINSLTILLLTLIGVAGIYYGYRFYFEINRRCLFAVATYIALMSGSLCSLVDRLFWGGSLDSIRIRVHGYVTIDFKDCYLIFGEVLLAILILLKFSVFRNLSGSMQTNSSVDIYTFKNFFVYVRNDILKMFQKNHVKSRD